LILESPLTENGASKKRQEPTTQFSPSQILPCRIAALFLCGGPG